MIFLFTFHTKIIYFNSQIFSAFKTVDTEETDLVHFLREKQFTGVVTIVCPDVDDLIKVEETLKNCSIEEYRKCVVYNPFQPHNSEDTVITSFIDNLWEHETKSDITGKLY